jgi:hypothetical protein
MTNILKLNLLCTVLLVSASIPLNAQTRFDFESLSVPTAGFYQGDPAATGPERNLYTVDSFGPSPFGGPGEEFVQRINVLQNGQSVDFGNTFDTSFGGFYSGFAISNTVDTTTPGFTNQYAAFPGSGADGSTNYLINSGSGTSATASLFFETIDIANTTYTAIATQGDDGNPTPFVSGPLADSNGYLDLIITGSNSAASSDQVVVSLADYRNGANFLAEDWRTVDVTALQSDQLTFTFDGSDVGTFGLNTPAYFAIDNVVLSGAAVPEPSAIVLLWAMGLSGTLFRRRSIS